MTEIQLIDSDVHPPYPPISDLLPHMTARWAEFARESGFQRSAAYENAFPHGAQTTGEALSSGRVARHSKSGGRSDAIASRMSPLDTLRVRVLDKTARYAILNLYYGVELIRHPDWAAALASACNDWLITNWLDKDPRLRAGIVVDPKYPDLAANEIDRASKHPGFVQVLLPVRSEVPYGNRRYAPLLEHAVSAGLAVGIQFGGFTGNATTPVGWPSTYFEDYVGMITAFQAQVLSLIVEGTFERLPGLKIALLEAGWTWIPSFLWRMDKDWKGFRREAPWVGAPPSAYVRKHFHATLQPMDASPKVASLLPYVEQIGADGFLLFASEYPHRHATPAQELLDLLSPALRGKIEHDNAAKLYDFDRATSVKTATTSPTPA